MTTEDKLNENTYRHKCSKTIINGTWIL